MNTLCEPEASSSDCTVCSFHSVRALTLEVSATAKIPVSTPDTIVMMNLAKVCPVYLQDQVSVLSCWSQCML